MNFLYSEYIEKLEKLQRLEKKSATPSFLMMLVIAVALHLAVLIIINLWPKQVYIQNYEKFIPIKIGDNKGVMAEFAKLPINNEYENIKKMQELKEIKSSLDNSILNSVKNSVRKKITRKRVGKAGTFGTKDIMQRYTQLLSAWIYANKIYPIEAQRMGMAGIVVLRIRIDRKGNILRASIQKSSGYQILDKAVLVAARISTPAPVMPNNYPGGDLHEFSIDVKFKP